MGRCGRGPCRSRRAGTRFGWGWRLLKAVESTSDSPSQGTSSWLIETKFHSRQADVNHDQLPNLSLGRAAVQIEAEYRTPVEHHNPMEPFATTVVRHEDGTLT